MTWRAIGALAALLLVSSQSAGSEVNRAALLQELNLTSATQSPIEAPPKGKVRIVGNSKQFSLLVPDPAFLTTARPSSPIGIGSRWNTLNNANPSYTAFDLDLSHFPEGSWIKGRVGRRSRDGMRGALRAEAAYAKQLIDYSPDEVVVDVSLDTYRASALYCGRLRGSTPRHCCSLVHVVLHGSQTVRLHSLIVASTPIQRDAVLREFARVMGTLALHP
jgi:hypothetical protein